MSLNRSNIVDKASDSLEVAHGNLMTYKGKIDKELFAGCRVFFKQCKFLEELNFSKNSQIEILNNYLEAVEVVNHSEPLVPIRLQGFENNYFYIMIAGKVSCITDVSTKIKLTTSLFFCIVVSF